jgi:hypothetical protein
MNAARLGIAAQSTGLSEAAYREALKYAEEREQFGKPIIQFAAVAEMLKNMEAKTLASRALLYETARFVDIYKQLNHISHERSLESEERQEMKFYNRLADGFTPIAKMFASEWANEVAYDSLQIHGGSGYMKDYACERLFRDARILNIYEGTTQLQVVAAIRYITNGTYLNIIKEMLQEEVCDCMKPLQARVAKLVDAYEAAIQKVKADENQDEHDFLGRRLYNMTADIVESLLIIADASKAPELFKKSANVFVRMAEEEVIGSAAYIQNFNAEDLKSFVAEDEETAE